NKRPASRTSLSSSHWRGSLGPKTAPYCTLIDVRHARWATLTQERTMAKTVSEVFVETLIAAGVQRVYGVVGDSLNGLTDAIRKSTQIDWLHVRHEETAAFAAGA